MKNSASLRADFTTVGVSSIEMDICSFTMNIVKMESLRNFENFSDVSDYQNHSLTSKPQ